MHIARHSEASLKAFLKRTISAQTHLFACGAATVATIILVSLVMRTQSSSHIAACLLYGVTAVILFAASSTYHFLSEGFVISSQLKRVLKEIDHFAIYLFIAGSYTPFVMNAVAQPWKSILIVAVWLLAIVGICYTHFKQRLPHWAQNRFVYTGIFVLMGWAIVVRIGEIYANISTQGMWFLVGGGLAYSIGAVIYATKRPKLFAGVFGFHELWHIMVMLGFGLHYFLILGFYN